MVRVTGSEDDFPPEEQPVRKPAPSTTDVNKSMKLKTDTVIFFILPVSSYFIFLFYHGLICGATKKLTAK